jgi:hypothetical protein
MAAKKSANIAAAGEKRRKCQIMAKTHSSPSIVSIQRPARIINQPKKMAAVGGYLWQWYGVISNGV